jgi:hypothetical protein
LVGSSPISGSRTACCVVLELRPLRSTGITRLPRYYGPLRHPSRPSLSLAGVSLAVTRRHRGGFPCCTGFLVNMPSPLPRRDRGAWLLVLPASSARMLALHSGGLPRFSDGSAPALPFSRPARRVLALRPADSRNRPRRSFPSKASTASSPPPPLRLLPAGATSCRIGLTPTENQRLHGARKSKGKSKGSGLIDL